MALQDRRERPWKLPRVRLEDLRLRPTRTIPGEAYAAYEALVDHALHSAGLIYDYGHSCHSESCCAAPGTRGARVKSLAPYARVTSRRGR